MRKIVIVILMAFASSAFAQEVKFDSAIISYYLAKHQLYISINGKEYTGDTLKPRLGENPESLHPFIIKIQEWEKRGWLCTDIKPIPAANGSRAYLAYLRKKKE